LGELLPELRQRGIRLMAYVSICFDNYALGLHPEWRAVTAHGDPQVFPPFYMACLNTPYQSFVLKQIEELAARYAVDGFWLDIMPLARDVPQFFITHFLPAPCYCLSCQQKYEAENGEPLRRGAAGEERAFHYLLGKVEGFLKSAAELIHRFQPEALVTYNSAGSPADPLDAADLVSIEGHAPAYLRQSFIARWARESRKPFEILMPGALHGWNGFDQKPTSVMQLEAAIAVSHGGSAVVGQAPFPDGQIDPPQYVGLRKVLLPIRELEPWLTAPQAVSDVGLVLAAKPRTASRLWSLMMDGAESFHEALLDTHCQYEIVRRLEGLSRYQLLILADQAALSEAELEAVRQYVRQGGRLIASGESSLWDETGNRRADFGLADVFGVSWAGEAAYSYAYLKLHAGPLADHVTATPMVTRLPPLEVKPAGAVVLADLLYPEALRTDATTILWGDPGPDADRRHPGICRSAYGRGECWYIAARLRPGGLPETWSRDVFTIVANAQRSRGFTHTWIKRLMGVLVKELVAEPILRTSAPPGVEVTLNRQAGRHVVHLVNHHAGNPEHVSFVDSGLILHDIGVELWTARLGLERIGRVYQPPRTELNYEMREGWLRFRVPELRVHSVVAVE
jgi:hypothetical protein